MSETQERQDWLLRPPCWVNARWSVSDMSVWAPSLKKRAGVWDWEAGTLGGRPAHDADAEARLKVNRVAVPGGLDVEHTYVLLLRSTSC